MTNKLLEIEDQDPKTFWKLIDNMRKWGKTSKDSADAIHQTKWYDHFSKLLNNNNENCIAKDQEKLLAELEKTPCFSKSDFRICEEELLKALNSLKKNKSPGPDNVIGELIIWGKDSLARKGIKVESSYFREPNWVYKR
eukprot:Seg2187.2 transcript_id=Seg2187.2/GoldUCD/mRNA.D3Y31 product="hypothetical protein" protein_id=Seg2187.2/GoldUCD/D3Y31